MEDQFESTLRASVDNSNDTYMESSIVIRVSKFIQQSFGNECEEHETPFETDGIRIDEYRPLLTQSPSPEPIPTISMWTKFKRCVSDWYAGCETCSRTLNRYHGYDPKDKA